MRNCTMAAVLAVALAGCQTAAEAPNTASGKPEVTIRATTAAIKARLLSLAMDKRFNVTKDTEYLLQVEKPSENFGAVLLMGSKYDGIPAERIVFTFAPIGETTRVVAAGMFVTNPGSAFERITPINGGEGATRTQQTLDELKATMETPITQPAAPVASARKPAKPAS
ncbi:hypothetical protein IVA99_06455 [Bradyrhizobium sp. 162]|nr:hypothetical protein [Bradyrhizobium sp. 162]